MLEQIYVDFTTKLLPQIQEGLVISKDYFFDLFGRYVTYLIWVDSITFVLLTGVLIACLVIGVKIFKWLLSDEDTDWVMVVMISMIPALILFSLVVFWWATGQQLIKDIYIPEIRVIEELRQYQGRI